MSDYHILKCDWKSGFLNTTIGDTFGSHKGFSLNHGEINIDGQPTARIVLRQYRPFADNTLVIENIEPFELALFYEKGCD